MLRKLLLAILLSGSALAQTTPNMGLVKPQIGVDTGAVGTGKVNTALDAIDAHDHSPGKGVKITPSGMSISADLPFGGNSATGLKKAGFNDQGGTLSSATIGSVYNCSGNLCWNNGSGVAIQITSGTAVNNPVTGAFAASAPGAYPYTVSTADAQKVLLVDTGSSRTLNLPAATTALLFAVKDITGSAATNAITVHRAGADTIDGTAADKSLASNYGWWFFVSDGVSNWSFGEVLGGKPTNGQLRIGNGNGSTLGTITGTANQVTVTNGAGSITLSIPATPVFTGLNLSGLTASQLVVTDASKNLASTLSPNLTGANLSGLTASRAVVTDGSKNLASGQDISSAATPSFVRVNLSGLTASLPVVTDGSNNLISQTYATFKAFLGLSSTDSPTFNVVTANQVTTPAVASGTSLSLAPNNTVTWVGATSGDLQNDGTNGGNLVFIKNGKGVQDSVNAAVAAAGANLAAATQLDSTVCVVTSGTGGVKLNNNLPVGAIQEVHNATGSSINIYPPDAGSQLDTSGAGVAQSLPSNSPKYYRKISSTLWYSVR